MFKCYGKRLGPIQNVLLTEYKELMAGHAQFFLRKSKVDLKLPLILNRKNQ